MLPEAARTLAGKSAGMRSHAPYRPHRELMSVANVDQSDGGLGRPAARIERLAVGPLSRGGVTRHLRYWLSSWFPTARPSARSASTCLITRVLPSSAAEWWASWF